MSKVKLAILKFGRRFQAEWGTCETHWYLWTWMSGYRCEKISGVWSQYFLSHALCCFFFFSGNKQTKKRCHWNICSWIMKQSDLHFKKPDSVSKDCKRVSLVPQRTGENSNRETSSPRRVNCSFIPLEGSTRFLDVCIKLHPMLLRSAC